MASCRLRSGRRRGRSRLEGKTDQLRELAGAGGEVDLGGAIEADGRQVIESQSAGEQAFEISRSGNFTDRGAAFFTGDDCHIR